MVVDLLTVGDAFEELILFGLPRLPRPGEELKTQNLARSLGGGAVLTALSAVRAGRGLRCQVVTAVNPWAQRLLRREGLSVCNLRQSREPHAISIALSTPADRSFVTFAGSNDLLEPRFLRALSRRRARHVHFAFQPQRCRTWLRPLADLRAAGATTSWDFGFGEALARDRGLAELAGAVDFLFLNDQEARLYAGTASLTRAIAYWRQHARHTVVTLGARGAQLIVQDGVVSAPARPFAGAETTGAGDAFNGGFLHALLAGQPLAACLRIGVAASAKAVRAPGGAVGLAKRVSA
jgi:sugar/nucleoside kinase (ribokinase family)